MNRLNEIKARLKAASPGPWNVGYNWEQQHPGLFIYEKQSTDCGTIITAGDEAALSKEDAEFIANAPDDIAFLLIEINKLIDIVSLAIPILKEIKNDTTTNSK